MGPYLEKVFEGIIKVRISRGGHPGFRVGPKASDKCSYKKRERKTQAHRGRLCEDTAEIAVMCLQAKGCQGQRAATRRAARNRFSLRASKTRRINLF